MTRVYCVLFWLILSTAPAWADLSLGIVPAKDSLIQNKQQANELASYLEDSLGEPVRLRIFNSESLLHQWLNRYREVDIAIISKAYHDSKRRGEFTLIVDYQPVAGSRLKPGTLVGRRGLSADTLQRLRDMLFVMDTDQKGAALLKQMQLESFSAPGTRVVLSKPAPVKMPTPKTRPVPAVAQPQPARPKPIITPEVIAKVTDSPATSKVEEPQIIEEAVSDPPATTPHDATTLPAPIAPVQDPGPAETAIVQTPPPGVEQTVVETPPVSLVTEKTAPLQGGDKNLYSRKTQQQLDAELEPTSGSGRKYLIAITIILLLGAGIKLFLIFQRRPRQRPAIPSSNMLIHHDWSELHQGQPTDVSAAAPVEPAAFTAEPVAQRQTSTAASKPTSPETEPVPESENNPFSIPLEDPSSTAAPQGLPSGQLQLDGNLGPRQIPAMLQLIAASGQSGSLKVSASHNEKLLTFSRGKITTASSRNISNKNQSGFLMNKLGYLLVRQGKINEEQRDQALVMCEGDSKLRLGEALLKMGAIKKVELQKSLCDQAKMILHSLIVFPEGRFEFTAGDPQISPEDNLRLSVNDFLKEAAAHQNEWRNIREMIPSLDTILEFAPGGQDKVSNGRMTVHQKFVLSLVDGQKPIRDICIAATMLDYELYRFLYLMTKANILQRSSS